MAEVAAFAEVRRSVNAACVTAARVPVVASALPVATGERVVGRLISPTIAAEFQARNDGNATDGGPGRPQVDARAVAEAATFRGLGAETALGGGEETGSQ